MARKVSFMTQFQQYLRMASDAELLTLLDLLAGERRFRSPKAATKAKRTRPVKVNGKFSEVADQPKFYGVQDEPRMVTNS